MQQKSRKEEQAFHDPYEKTALIYDSLMSHVDYAKWAHYLIRIFKKHEIWPESILDIACGTGSLIEKLAGRGFNCTGIDYSRQMVKLAAKKLKRLDIPLITGDMSNIPVTGKFDVLLCLYDSMNYLESIDSIVQCAQEAVKLLNPNGMFIFDLCTEHNCMEYFDGYYQNGSTGTFSYVRKSMYDFERKIQYNDFVIVKSRSGAVSREKHVQHIFSIEEAALQLETVKNITLSQYKNMTLKKPDRYAERIHFVLQKN